MFDCIAVPTVHLSAFPFLRLFTSYLLSEKLKSLPLASCSRSITVALRSLQNLKQESSLFDNNTPFFDKFTYVLQMPHSRPTEARTLTVEDISKLPRIRPELPMINVVRDISIASSFGIK